MTDLKISRDAGQTGGAAETSDQTSQFLRKDGLYAQPARCDTVFGFNAGTDTAGSAPVLTPSFTSGTAAQLADTTRDYMVYLQFGAAGTGLTLAIGPTSTPASTLISNAAVSAGQVVTFRLPAGWFAEVSFTTTTLAHQSAVGC